MHRRTDMTVLIVAVCDFSNAPKMDSQLVFPPSIPTTHFYTLHINAICPSSSWSSKWLFPKDVDTKLYMLSNSILFSTNKPFWTKIKYSSMLSVNLLCQMSCKSIILFGRWHVQQDLSMRQYIQKILKSMSVWCKYKVYVTICILRSNTHIHQFYLVEHLLQLWYSHVLLYSGNNLRCKLRKASQCTGITMSCIQPLTYLKKYFKNCIYDITGSCCSFKFILEAVIYCKSSWTVMKPCF